VLSLLHLLAVGNMVLKGGRTVLDAMPHHPKVKGSSPVTAFVTLDRKNVKKKENTDSCHL
jgi:hypothetical protein